jgi:hypothetical protein
MSFDIILLDNDDKTPAYKMQYTRNSILQSKHDIDIIRLGSSKGKGSGTVVGSISHRKLSSKLDLSIHNKSTSMESNGTFKKGGCFTSTFPGAGVLTWEKEGMLSDHLILTDSRGKKYARYALSYFSTKKMAKIEILMSPVPASQVLDEIVVSGLAVANELNRKGRAPHYRAMRGIGGGSAAC